MKEYSDVIIVAAGSGTRLGYKMPKAFVPLHNRPLLSYSLDVFLSCEFINRVILVVPQSMQTDSSIKFSDPKIDIISGGKERWQSVRNGVKYSAADWVLVHDAARPFVTKEIIDAVFDKKYNFQCVITATHVIDTIRSFKGDQAGPTIDRSTLIRVGTPQLFKRQILSDLFETVDQDLPPPTDEAILFQNAGLPIGISWGDPNNFKITTKSDIKIAEALISAKNNL